MQDRSGGIGGKFISRLFTNFPTTAHPTTQDQLSFQGEVDLERDPHMGILGVAEGGVRGDGVTVCMLNAGPTAHFLPCSPKYQQPDIYITV